MKINKFINKRPYLISGPCSAESERQVYNTAYALKDTIDVFRAGLWKPRTKPGNFQGIGAKGLSWLNKIQDELKLKVCTEVATPKHVELCLNAGIDILWIGARTTVNPIYIDEICEALKGVNIPVFVKNPIHPELGLWLGAFERLNKFGINNLAAIHRGFFSYSKNTYRNDPKWEVIIKLRKENQNIPVLCDASHIAGNSIYIEDICQTAMDLDLDGLMIETHYNPAIALSDAMQQIKPELLINIMNNLVLKDSSLKDKNFEKKLLQLRNEIDLLDQKTIFLLKKRKHIVEKIANFKNEKKITIFQIERWLQILRTRKKEGEKWGIDSQMISELFEIIHKYSILTQTKIMRNS